MKNQKWIEINDDPDTNTGMLAINMPNGIMVKTVTCDGGEMHYSTAFVPGLWVFDDGTVSDE